MDAKEDVAEVTPPALVSGDVAEGTGRDMQRMSCLLMVIERI